MASKREQTIKNLILVLTIFVWLRLLTVLQIKNFRVTEQKDTGREKRSVKPNPSTSAGGASYIRWGRKDCPHDTELVYRGVAGGGHYTQEGGGSNYVCLTDNPNYANIRAGENGAALIYGTEFEVSGYSLFGTSNSQPHNLAETDVQCSVCRSHSRSSMVMIPGMKECPAGWNKEYWGYLMTAKSVHKAQHDFVCVDNSPDSGTEGGRKDENGALMYHVEGRCGSLPGPPYVNGAELTCVVCTK